MTENEALNYLNPTSDEDVEDAFERIFFEHKQFFLTKPLLLKTAESRISKLQQLADAVKALQLTVESQPFVSSSVEFVPSDHVLEHFTRYTQAKQAWKTQLTPVRSIENLVRLIGQGLELERTFSSKFQAFSEWTEEVPVIGTDLDWMQFLKLLREQSDLERTTLTDLWKSRSELPIELLRALKRLSLLKNYV